MTVTLPLSLKLQRTSGLNISSIRGSAFAIGFGLTSLLHTFFNTWRYAQ